MNKLSSKSRKTLYMDPKTISMVDSTLKFRFCVLAVCVASYGKPMFPSKLANANVQVYISNGVYDRAK